MNFQHGVVPTTANWTTGPGNPCERTREESPCHPEFILLSAICFGLDGQNAVLVVSAASFEMKPVAMTTFAVRRCRYGGRTPP